MKPFVFFDIDDTLYRRAVPFRRAAESFFSPEDERIRALTAEGSETAVPPDRLWEQVFQRTQKRCEEVYFPVLQGKMTAEEGFVFRFQKGFEDAGIRISRQEALALSNAYQKAQKMISPDPAAEKLLTECKRQGAEIGLITNGKGPHQRAKIESLGLERWVNQKLAVISGEIGIDKPDLRVFAYAAGLAGAVPEQLIYVGDSPENDILPAEKAGWYAVLWDRTDPEQSIKKVLQLQDFIKNRDQTAFPVFRRSAAEQTDRR